VILLPRAQLPLNIFEPRYLNMTLDALGGRRLIGMAQPDGSGAPEEVLYPVGCAGRITAFSETEDGRLLIVLTGVCRFRIEEELATIRGYRRVRPAWERFATDLDPADDRAIRPEELMRAAREYAEANQIELDLETLAQLAPEALVNALSMHLPFAAAEKQSLVEAHTPAARAEALIALIRFASVGEKGPAGTWH
jgi:Lon protease-like protein